MKNKLSNEEIIIMFKDFANKLGRTPSQQDICNKRKINKEFLTTDVIRIRFGGINNLAKLCGLQPNVLLGITDEELIKNLKDFYNKNGFIPSKKNFINYKELPNISFYERRFNGILNALEIAGIPLSKERLSSKNKNTLSKEEIINIFIRFYNNNGFMPKLKELSMYNLPKESTIMYNFKNYKNLLIAMNIDIEEITSIIGYKTYKTNEELLNILKEYNNTVGFPIIRAFTSKNNLPSYTLYYDRFVSFQNAILLSGIIIPDNRKHYFNRDHLSDKEMLSLLKYYTDEKLKDNIYLLTNDEIDNIQGIPHTSTYTTRFGGIIDAYKNINIDYYEFNRKALENDMKEKYIALKEKLGHIPNSREIDKASNLGECYSMHTYSEHFNSLSDFQKMMGDIPTILGKSINEDDALEGLKILGQQLQRTPTQLDVGSCSFLPGYNYYATKFNSFKNALLCAGFDDVKIYISPRGNKALSLIEYHFLLMLENKNINFVQEEFYNKYIEGFKRKFRFDFTIVYENKKYLIEIFGIVGIEDYDKRKKEKIKLCEKYNLPLIDFYYKDFYKANEDKLYQLLLDKITYSNKLNKLNI
jgi:hypothetical protein